MLYSPNTWTVRLLSIIFLGLLSIVVSPVWAQQTLENPQPDSFQSGVGVISGWACNANTIEISFNGGPRFQAALGTIREDTQGVCGDTDNGFGLLYNWNRLGDGVHTVTAYADGVEFASAQVTVTTLGEEFLRGASGTLPLPDFPIPGTSRTLRWQQAQQNFVITAGNPQGGGTSGAAPHVLENPQPGSFQSGVGVISGWACNAQTLEISFDGGPRIQAGTGTIREDTQGVCGDTNNGFGLLYNWNRLGEGPHTVTAYADGDEFARVTVTVTTLGEEFRRGLSHVVGIPDFPAVGTDVVLQWQEAQQNFVIIHELPTQRLVEVTPTVALPAGVQIPNVSVSSLYSETATVRASPEPTLLIAEDADSIVLLGLANMDGGLLGDRPGEAEVSVDSTVVTLVGLIAGIPVTDMTPGVVDAIVTHPHYPAITTALSAGLASDPHFLANIGEDAEPARLIEAVADDLPRVAPPQGVFADTAPSRQAPSGEPAPPGTVLPDAETEDPRQRILELLAECDIDLDQDSAEVARLQERFREIGISLASLLAPIEPAGRVGVGIANRLLNDDAIAGCVLQQERQWYARNPDRIPVLSPTALHLDPWDYTREVLSIWPVLPNYYQECASIIGPPTADPYQVAADVFQTGLSFVPIQTLLSWIPKIGPILARGYGSWEKAQERETVRTALEEAVEAVEEFCGPRRLLCKVTDNLRRTDKYTGVVQTAWFSTCLLSVKSYDTECPKIIRRSSPCERRLEGSISREAYPLTCEGFAAYRSACAAEVADPRAWQDRCRPQTVYYHDPPITTASPWQDDGTCQQRSGEWTPP